MKDKIRHMYILDRVEYSAKYALSVPNVGDFVTLNTGTFVVIGRRFDYRDNDAYGNHDSVAIVIKKVDDNDPKLMPYYVR